MTSEEFMKQVREIPTHNSLESLITYQLNIVQFYISNMINMQIMTLVNGLQQSFNVNQIIVKRPSEDDKEALWMLGEAYCSIWNKFNNKQ